MQVASLKISLWRFCIMVPSSQIHACSGACIWKELMNRHSGMHLMPQLSSCCFPVQATLRDSSKRWLKTLASVIADLDAPQIFALWYKSLWLSHESSFRQMFWIICFQEQALGQWSGATFPNMFTSSSHAGISATQVKPCPASLAGLQHLLWWHPMGWATFRSWECPWSVPMFSSGCNSILLSNLSVRESSHTVEFDPALITISPLFQSADKQPQLTKSLVPYSTNPGW